MYEVQPPGALGVRVELVGVIVRHVVLGRERHHARLLKPRTEIDNAVAERHYVELRDKDITHPYGLEEHLVHYGSLVHRRRYGHILHKLLVGNLDNVLLGRLVDLSVEKIVTAPVPFHGTRHGQLPYAPAELGQLHAVLATADPSPVTPQRLKTELRVTGEKKQLGMQRLYSQQIVSHNNACMICRSKNHDSAGKIPINTGFLSE